jgi:hypothetical protein
MKIMIPEEGLELRRKEPHPSWYLPFFAHRSTFLFRPTNFLQDINYFKGLQGLFGRKISARVRERLSGVEWSRKNGDTKKGCKN